MSQLSIGFSQSLQVQPRYMHYAAAHGNEPSEQLEADHGKYPGGRMCGYILWISEQRRVWRKELALTNQEHHYYSESEFDLWLGRAA